MRLIYPSLAAMAAGLSLHAYAEPPSKPAYRVPPGVSPTVQGFVPMWVDPNNTTVDINGDAQGLPTPASPLAPFPVQIVGSALPNGASPAVIHSAPTGATVPVGATPTTIIPADPTYVGWTYKVQGTSAPGQIACGSWATTLPTIGTLNGAPYCSAGFQLAPSDSDGQNVGGGALFTTPFTAIASAAGVFAISYQVQNPAVAVATSVGVATAASTVAPPSSIGLVQQVGADYTSNETPAMTFPATPTPGNTLVWLGSYSNYQGGVIVPPGGSATTIVYQSCPTGAPPCLVAATTPVTAANAASLKSGRWTGPGYSGSMVGIEVSGSVNAEFYLGTPPAASNGSQTVSFNPTRLGGLKLLALAGNGNNNGAGVLAGIASPASILYAGASAADELGVANVTAVTTPTVSTITNSGAFLSSLQLNLFR